ncbi:MAG: hypothetical protein JWO43_256 [Candidatus Adlerbacteria bacterium]|nr:hypothetical protein [Candidatus Adlerbacteria bacterium]
MGTILSFEDAQEKKLRPKKALKLKLPKRNMIELDVADREIDFCGHVLAKVRPAQDKISITMHDKPVEGRPFGACRFTRAQWSAFKEEVERLLSLPRKK